LLPSSSKTAGIPDANLRNGPQQAMYQDSAYGCAQVHQDQPCRRQVSAGHREAGSADSNVVSIRRAPSLRIQPRHQVDDDYDTPTGVTRSSAAGTTMRSGRGTCARSRIRRKGDVLERQADLAYSGSRLIKSSAAKGD
jgi:hypothetical protein